MMAKSEFISSSGPARACSSTFLDELQAKAAIWRRRPPSGLFVLHRLKRSRFCYNHGQVTKYHFCQISCALSEFRCLPGCSRAECGTKQQAQGDPA
jgi:hypothetical protein